MIHETAIIDKNAIIPDNCEIGAYTIIGEGVKLGENVKISSHVYLEHCDIGENTIISPFASIGSAPQDYGYKGEKTKAIIGKNCIIREYVTVNRSSGENTNTIVGDNCMLMTSSHVAHNCTIGDHVIMANAAILGGHISIGAYAFIGGLSVFHQNIRIGQGCIVSGDSAARQDILPFSKSDGRPATPHGINTLGLKRRGFTLEQRTNLKNAFKIIQFSKLTFPQIADKIEAEIPQDENVKHLAEFIRTSKRGISGGSLMISGDD